MFEKQGQSEPVSPEFDMEFGDVETRKSARANVRELETSLSRSQSDMNKTQAVDSSEPATGNGTKLLRPQ
jgi:hypothetical protein